MMIKAIFTGVVLAGLSGSIVYFGAGSADTVDGKLRAEANVEDTELAGAAESELLAESRSSERLGEDKVAETILAETHADIDETSADSVESDVSERTLAEESADVLGDEEMVGTVGLGPQPTGKVEGEKKTKPKGKWLDQYLKSSKAKKSPENKSSSEAVDVENPVDSNIEIEVEKPPKATAITKSIVEVTRETETDAPEDRASTKEVLKKKIIVRMDGDNEATWTSNVENIEVDENFDLDMIEDLIRDHRDAETNVRVLRFDSAMTKPVEAHRNRKGAFDYGPVLKEAKKLQVIDMRNIAFFEIIDYAVDRGDFGQAADVLQELSDPELRDTARR